MAELPKIHGDERPVEQASALSYTPSQGWVSAKQYVGTDKEIRSLANSIKAEKTDDAAGTPPAVSLTVTPLEGGLATLDVSYDDDIGTGVEFTQWSLQASDYEKNIWTHPTLRSLHNLCGTEYNWIRENLPAMQENGTFDPVLEGWSCNLLANLHQYSTRWNFRNTWQADRAPTPDDDMNDNGGFGYSSGSFWVSPSLDRSWICVSALPAAAVWNELGTACCTAGKAILTMFRDGIESYIVSQYVLRKTIVLPTTSKDVYALANVNKRVNVGEMTTKEGVPAGLKFAMPDYGEWLKKAPQVDYARNKMTINQEYWHAEDWNNYIYQPASY
jgi:hypothetical protein